MFWVSFDWDFVTGSHYTVRCRIPRRRPLTKQALKDGLRRLSWVQRLLNRVAFDRVVLRDEHHEILPFLQPKDLVWDVDWHWDTYNHNRIPDCANWVHHARDNAVRVRSATDEGGGKYWTKNLLSKLRPQKVGCLFIAWSGDYSDNLWDGQFIEFLKQFPQVDFAINGKKYRESWIVQQWRQEAGRTPLAPEKLISASHFRRVDYESLRCPIR